MAQAVHCDHQGSDTHLADVLVSQLANGDTTAWCFTHYVDVCQAVLDTVAATEAEAAQAAADANARLEGVTPPAGQDEPEEVTSAGLAGFSDPTGPDDAGAGQEGPEPVQEGLGGTETGDGAEGAPESTAEPSDAPGAVLGPEEEPQAEPATA